jgi:hypothetical protein
MLIIPNVAAIAVRRRQFLTTVKLLKTLINLVHQAATDAAKR